MKRYFDKQSNGDYLMRAEHLPAGHVLIIRPRWPMWKQFKEQQYFVEHYFWRQCPQRRKRKMVYLRMGRRGLMFGCLNTARHWAKLKAEWLNNEQTQNSSNSET